MGYIIRPGDSDAAHRLGGKAGALADLHPARLPIPAWFALAPEAFFASANGHEGQEHADARELASVRGRLDGVTPSHQIRRELAEALAWLCPNGERVAVRSSACDEDGVRHSFAGQLDSFLSVFPSDVADRVAAVWRSAFGERVLAYQRQQGLSPTARPPAVLIQRMVSACRSGVAFGADPVTGRRGVAVVSAVYGLGTGLVSGECDADTYHVDREGRILHRDIVDKRTAHLAAANGLRRAELPSEDCTRPALTDDEVRAVAALVRQAGRHFGRPQDIEWAIEDGQLYLLQSRPITAVGPMADPDGVLNLWDNSNIAESYGGVTIPLTFSFARRAYEEVYRQFCRIMRVPAATVAAHDDTFRRMLGLIRGRVYYNLPSWYRVLAMLPGYTINRRFMEQMMGVREGLPEGLLAERGNPTWRDQLRDGFHLVGTLSGLIFNHLLLPRRIKRFSERLDAALGPPRPALEDMRPDELALYYHLLERELLTRWDAPLVNDFFAMIFFGALRRLAERWCQDQQSALQTSLLSGEGGMVSAEPAKRLRGMARLAAPHPEFVALLCDGSLVSILEGMQRLPSFKDRYQDYLDAFGDRCLEELKLESPTLHDDPLMLLRPVGRLAKHLPSSESAGPSGIERDERVRAEGRAQEALAGHPLRRLVFRWVLRQARARVRERENLRFERTRLFGRVRRIFLEFGQRFFALGLLEAPRDIFYLEVEEILGFVKGTATSTNLKGLVALRKAEYQGYRQSEAPPDRFETRGMVSHSNLYPSGGRVPQEMAGDQCKGIGCSPGIVRGPARVIIDPRNAAIQKGEILVAERTDPGWILLFPSAAGLVVEHGSLLSHSAIVAREMGIPAVLSIRGVTRWVKDGDWIEIDGVTGVVRRVTAPHEVAGNGS